MRTLEIDTDKAHDTRTALERNQKIHEDLKSGAIEEGVYRGLGGYKQYMERGEGAIANSKYSGLLGPTRGMTQVRTTIRFDYWGTTGDGGVCKDYKESGYCGFGDTCKFMHDRSDYKAGWQLDKEWEEQQKQKEKKLQQRLQRRLKRKTGEENSDDNDLGSNASSQGSSDDEGLPFSCLICRERWEDCESQPVETICNHYFCENCAMEQFAKSSKCAYCGAMTNGIFNTNDSLMEKAKQKREEKKQRKASSSKSEAQLKGTVPYNKNLEEDDYENYNSKVQAQPDRLQKF